MTLPRLIHVTPFLLSALIGVGSADALPFGGRKAKPNEFKPEEVSSPAALQKNARRYWKQHGLGKIRKAGFTSVAITEFNVEIMTSADYDASGKGNFGLADIGQLATGAGRKAFEFSDGFKQELPGRLYERFVSQLGDAGYEVKSLGDVAGSTAYAKFRGRNKTDKNRASGKYKSSRTEVYPVDGLVDLKDGAFAQMGNMNANAELLHELGVDVGLRVHVKVGIAKKGSPAILTGSMIQVSAGVDSNTGPGGKTRYWVEKYGSVSSKDGFFYPERVTKKAGRKGTRKKHEVDEVAYESKLMEMFPPYMGMAISMFDQKG